MSYEYITENNLIHRQKYEYTQFRGEDFIQDYLASREREMTSDFAGLAESDACSESSLLYQRIKALKEQLEEKVWADETRNSLNDLIQSFEVRKRLYDFVNEQWRPQEEKGGFEDYSSYLLFGEILVYVYKREKNLKYLNCLLKLDDTLLSVKNHFDRSQRKHLSEILREELSFFKNL